MLLPMAPSLFEHGFGIGVDGAEPFDDRACQSGAGSFLLRLGHTLLVFQERQNCRRRTIFL
jgi:hypothetical protein